MSNGRSMDALGSPPPMRGKDQFDSKRSKWCRITPAYAGKSLLHLTFHNRHEDHPRLCGEKVSGILIIKPSVGSPPPMRGKAIPRKTQLLRNGITPAYAGKSTGGGLDGTFYKDHPRLCGEKSDLFLNIRQSVGSPPPMRGKANALDPVTISTRITPAYAGKRH